MTPDKFPQNILPRRHATKFTSGKILAIVGSLLLAILLGAAAVAFMLHHMKVTTGIW